ncbi:MAG: TlpA family protein disulfide reductase [Myxococcota bacterium]|nr:TlpA family protein disulfide reductase [Myxococcota bacterium]
MKLLPALLALVAVVLHGCGDDDADIRPEGQPEALPSRVEAVAPRQEDPAARFCDVSAPAGEGRMLELPPLEGESAPTSGWRWINVWATWCEPCVEEMPLIARWRERLAADDAAIETFFLSVDRTEGEVSAFHALHPDAPSTSRIVDPDGLEGLVASLGLDAGATIPIHALVDPEGHIRCVRTGSIAERDYTTVRAIIRGPGVLAP